MSTISCASSCSTSVRIEATSRLRCGPRNDGIAQNPHVRSQPSAIFTYAHGDELFGRGRFKRSSVGTCTADTGMLFFFDFPDALGMGRFTGTPKPAT